MTTENGSLPSDGLIRSLNAGLELREAGDGEGGPGVLAGHFAVFNEWTEIKSLFEGHFLERIAPGAFKKTFSERADKIKVLFEHGQDPDIGNKPLGKVRSLGEDEHGASYEVDLFDGIPALIMDGLRHDQYGSSFRFRVEREDLDRNPKRSEHNPDGLPERTIKEVHLAEFGPVTFPAYAGATAGLRSGTDHFVFQIIERDPELIRSLLNLDPGQLDLEGDEPAPATADAATSNDDGRTSARARRSTSLLGTQQKEREPWRLS